MVLPPTLYGTRVWAAIPPEGLEEVWPTWMAAFAALVLILILREINKEIAGAVIFVVVPLVIVVAGITQEEKYADVREGRLGQLLPWSLGFFVLIGMLGICVGVATVWRQRAEGRRRRDIEFEAGIKVFRQFVEREGHGLVPMDHIEKWCEEDFPLYRWCRDRASDRRIRRLRRHNVERLEQLDIDWDPEETEFCYKVEALMQFMDREGHDRPGYSHCEDYKGMSLPIGRWCSWLRSKYLLGATVRETMATHRASRLDDLGFDWELRP